MDTTQTKLDQFTRAYIECALWSSHDNADDSGGDTLDSGYDASDIAPATLAKMIEDCVNFQSDESRPLSLCSLDSSRAGHNFWLTRNRHGAGFWDEKTKGLVADKALDRLTQAAHDFGTFDLYVGADGMIYGS